MARIRWRWARVGKLDIQRIGRTGLVPKWQIEILKSDREISSQTHGGLE